MRARTSGTSSSRNNRVQGCFKYGILVNGVGRLEEDGSDPANPVVIAGNTIEIMIEGSNLSDSPAAGIVVRRNNLPGDNPPEKRIGSALITGNVIRGPANSGTAGTAGTIVEGRGIWIDRCRGDDRREHDRGREDLGDRVPGHLDRDPGDHQRQSHRELRQQRGARST